MNKIILSARDWRIYRALWLLMVMALWSICVQF